MRPLQSALILLILGLHQARADDERTFLGKTVAEWAAVFRDETRPERERKAAAWALGCFRKEASAVVSDMIAALRQGKNQDEALDLLLANEAGSELTVPPLIERFVKLGCSHHTEMGAIGYLPQVEYRLVGVGAPPCQH